MLIFNPLKIVLLVLSNLLNGKSNKFVAIDLENSFLLVYLWIYVFFYKSLHSLIYFNIRNRKFVAYM
jgi:hypothetical protein